VDVLITQELSVKDGYWFVDESVSKVLWHINSWLKIPPPVERFIWCRWMSQMAEECRIYEVRRHPACGFPNVGPK